MLGFDLHEFNALSKLHNYFLTDNRINGFPSLKKDSIFLQKVIKNKLENSSNNAKPYQNFRNLYYSPDMPKKNIITLNRNTSNKINSRYNLPFGKITVNINNINNNKCSPLRNDYKNTWNNYLIKNKSNNNIFLNRNRITSNSPDEADYITPRTSNNICDKEYEIRTINYKGSKIFASKMKNENKSQNKIGNIKKSELYRNFDELMKKKNEILNRKIKRNNSEMMKDNLKMQKNKELKKQNLDIKIEKSDNYSPNRKKMQIINLGTKMINYISNSPINSKMIENRTFNNQNVPNNNLKIIYLNTNPYMNNSYEDKGLSRSPISFSKMNYFERSPNSIRRKYIRKNSNEKKNTFDSYNNINSIERNSNPFNFIKKKIFVEDYNQKNSYFFSNDKKVTIYINKLNNMKETFEGKNPTREKLRMQRVISILFTNNNRVLKRRINKYKKSKNHLSFIKEEETMNKNKSDNKNIQNEQCNIVKSRGSLRKKYILNMSKKG